MSGSENDRYTGVYGQLRHNENHNVPSHQRQIDCYVGNAGRYGQKRSEDGALKLTQQALTEHGFLDGNLGMDPTVVSSEGSTALIQAAEAGYSTVVQYILEKTPSEQRANFINHQDGREAYRGDTALIVALRQNRPQVALELIKAGANVNVRGKDNNTALIWAARNGHVEVVKALIEAGANVNAQDRQGYSALMKAAYRGHSEVVHMLLTHKNSSPHIDVNLTSVNKDKNGSPENAYSLADGAIDPKGTRDREGNRLPSPYRRSVRHLIKNQGKIDFLLEVEIGNMSMVKVYMNSLKGNDAKKQALQTVDSKGRNVLIMAAASGNHELVKYILDEAANVMNDTEYRDFVCSTDSNGYTPLMHAVASASKETVEVFLNHEKTQTYVLPNQRNSQGHSALWVARKLKEIDPQRGQEMEDLLNSHVTDYGENLPKNRGEGPARNVSQVLKNHASSGDLQENPQVGLGLNNQAEIA